MKHGYTFLLLTLGIAFLGLEPALAQDQKPGQKPAPTAAAPKPAATAKPATPNAAAPKPTAPRTAAPKTTAPTTPSTAALQESYAAMPLRDRVAIQSDLIWSGDYNGTATGEFGDRAIAAVKAFQKRNKSAQSGVLTPSERALLATAVKAKQDQVGWRLLDDSTTGARIGLPGKLAPQAGAGKSGSRWTSARGEVQIETFRVRQQDTTLQSVFEQQKKEPADRKVEYNVIRPDFFVISGLQGLKKFYVRAQIKDGEVRGMTVLYDQAMDGIMEPVVVAMSSTFAAFPEGPLAGPPPRPKVEYATGLVMTKTGDIVTSREATEACQTIVVAGHGHADRVAEDKDADLALLRLYGARDLAAVPLGSEAPKTSELTLVGIADPQVQGGGAKVSAVAARLGTNGAGVAIEPAPAQGFTGAAALDAQGQLAGMVALKPAVPAQLISAAAIRKFLDAQKVAQTSGRATLEQAQASAVRVICVRK